MRTKVFTASLALAFCIALALGVQAQSKMSHSAKTGKNITVTGCVQTGTEPDTFMLNNVMTASSSQSKSSGTPSEMARSEASSYTLIPEGKVNLQSYVGQRVRVTGKISGEGTTNQEPSTEGTPSSSSQKLMVTAIHKVPGTCP
jgi:hypothetical protein